MDAEKWDHFQATTTGYAGHVSHNQVESGILGSSLGGGDPVFSGNAGSKLPQGTKGVYIGFGAMYLYSFVLFVFGWSLVSFVCHFRPND